MLLSKCYRFVKYGAMMVLVYDMNVVCDVVQYLIMVSIIQPLFSLSLNRSCRRHSIYRNEVVS